MLAWCWPLTISDAARSTVSGHSASSSGSESGRTASKARTAGSSRVRSSPAPASTEESVTASSATAHELIRSPKSMTPTGRSRPAASAHRDHVVVGEVAVDRLHRQLVARPAASAEPAPAAVARTASAPPGRATYDASRVTTCSACRRSHWSSRSGTSPNEASARTVRPARSPRSATTGGERYAASLSIRPST